MLVRVISAKGSTPREGGAFMLVAGDAMFGTIGGGRLELDAIAAARAMLAGARDEATLDIALGPDINQCCGGRVTLHIQRLTTNLRQSLLDEDAAARGMQPAILLFGAGHVGRALAQALAPLPFSVSLIDTRPDALEPPIAGVTATAAALPESLVRLAPAGSAVVILTHDHALDFAIVEEALKRDDLAYVGLIGSKTKKAVFRSQFLAGGGTLAQFARLVCPIGANPTGDKRPHVIAAFVATELCARLLAPERRNG
jgi:xanthine dehydrogenase accessory factor